MPQDIAGNTQTSFVVGSASNTYTVNLTAPISLLTNPSSSFTNSLTAITGTMTGNSPVTTINVQISSPAASPTSYWNGASWQEGATSVPATNVYISSWTYTVPGTINWANGQTFNIKTQAIDSVGNTETLGANGNQNFTYIVTFPSSTIQVPVANNYYNNFTIISGTAAVTTAGDQINNIQLAVQDTVTQDWWLGGTSWGNTGSIPTWTSVNNPGLNWSESPLPTGMFNGRSTHQFQFASRAQDRAGNYEQGGNGNTPFTVVFDTNPPTSALTSLISGTVLSTITVVTGTANDNSSAGFTRMKAVAVNLYSADGRTYCPTNAQAAANGWFTPTAPNPTTPWDPSYATTATYTNFGGVGASSGTWSFNIPNLTNLSGSNGLTFSLIVLATDTANNTQTTWSTTTFSLDQYQASPQSPNALVTTPADQSYTNSPVGTISGSGTDLVSLSNITVKLMQLTGGTTNYLSTAGNWVGADPGIYPAVNSSVSGTPVSWTFTTVNAKSLSSLITPNLQYQVTAIATNGAGIAQRVLSTNTFVYDTLFPTATITFPSLGGYVSANGQVAGTTFDNIPGISSNVYVRISTNSFGFFWTGSSWTANSNTWLPATLASSTTWTLIQATSPWSSTNFAAEAYGVDAAGNAQTAYSTVTFTADFINPSSTVTWPNQNTLTLTLSSVTAIATDNSVVSNVRFSFAHFTSSLTYWNPTDVAFDTSTPMYVNATLASGSWTVTGVNMPTFPTSVSGWTYYIFAQAVDGANNTTLCRVRQRSPKHCKHPTFRSFCKHRRRKVRSRPRAAVFPTSNRTPSPFRGQPPIRPPIKCRSWIAAPASHAEAGMPIFTGPAACGLLPPPADSQATAFLA